MLQSSQIWGYAPLKICSEASQRFGALTYYPSDQKAKKVLCVYAKKSKIEISPITIVSLCEEPIQTKIFEINLK